MNRHPGHGPATDGAGTAAPVVPIRPRGIGDADFDLARRLADPAPRRTARSSGPSRAGPSAPAQPKKVACALIIDRSADGRGNTEVAVIGTLSRLGDAMVRAYLRDLGIEMMGEALLFRTRTKQPYRDTALSHDFADVPGMVDPEDRRQMRDMRRSGTTEAFRGGADSKAVAQKFANSIDRSAFLFKTYNPVDLEQVREADQARVRGRRKRNSA